MASSSTATQNQTHPENAFDEVAPYYPPPKSNEPWDIFINHYGRDVKHTLTTAIYDKIHSMGFHVFLDKEALQAGDCIPPELQHAIATAALHIAIFSPNYASSPWCLAELSFMLKSGAKIIPIFYHVDPADLRYTDQGKGIYAPAFSEHSKKRRYSHEKLCVWKRALRDISFLYGYAVHNNEDEARVLKNIVNCLLQIMKKAPLWVAEHPLGLDELVQGFDSVISEDEVKIMGIVGMGGSGKTTLAKDLYNRNYSSFERCSFVFDVRDAASRNALCEKQKKLLADLGLYHSPFDHVDEGKLILANRLSGHRALIVLDDVDHIDQLNALLPKRENLGSQSMVVVTTRELGVLKSWGLNCIYHMPALSNPHARHLFCWHAFLQPSPPAEFETLVQDFLKACNGLPLSLKLLGAQLYGRKCKDYWESQLHKMLRILPGEIKQTLQLSYEALDEEEKEMFLDVACFFIGKDKNRAIAVWDGSGWSGLHGLETLVNKCLVELVEEKDLLYEGCTISRIRMHDHLRDMGREVASKQSPHRLWSAQQIHKHSTRRKQIRGIQPADAFVAFKELVGNSSSRSKLRRFSNELQILSVEGNEFTEEFASSSEHLAWLRWASFPRRNLPSWLPFKNLRVLELSEAQYLEELWQGNANPPLQLRELILKGTHRLQWLPSSIRHLRHLKRFVAEFYGSTLPEEFCGLKSLESLLLHSPDLSSLPASFGNLTSLRHLNFRLCPELTRLPNSFSQLKHLEVLNIEGSKLSSLPVGFGNLTRLKKIYLQSCKQLRMLPYSFSKLIHLEVVHLNNCKSLSSLPVDFGNLTRLKEINLSYCKRLSTLPNSFGQLIHLEALDLFCCRMLSSLPAGFGNLTSLRNAKFSICEKLSTLPVSFKQLMHLEVLELAYCSELKFRSDMLENIRKLKELNLTGCEELEDLPHQIIDQGCLTKLNLVGCIKLRCVDLLPVSLKDLSICSCDLVKNISCIGGLIKLEHLRIWNCLQIEQLPSLAGLVSLQSFLLEKCPKVKKIQGLEEAKALKFVTAEAYIQSLEKAERLDEVRLKCESISAVKPCIKSIKGKACPRRIRIEGSVICSVEGIIKSLEFADAVMTEGERPSSDVNEIPFEGELDDLITEAEIPSDISKIPFEGGLDAILCYMEEESYQDRKVVSIHYAEYLFDMYKKATVVSGRRGRIVEAFYQLLEFVE